jgi:DNA-binding XRE family transcriptional regulator
MAQKPDPASERQKRLRAQELADPTSGWAQQVLRLVAHALLAELSSQSEAEGWDLSTPEGWEGLRKHLATTDWAEQNRQRAARLEEVSEGLGKLLEHSPHLGAGFYSHAARRVADMLTGPRNLPVRVVAGLTDVRQDMEVGLPPQDHPLACGSLEAEEAAARVQVAWLAARGLWVTLGNKEPDDKGRRGLARPEVLLDWAGRLGLLTPGGDAVDGLAGPYAIAPTPLVSNRVQDGFHSPRQTEGGHLLTNARPGKPATYAIRMGLPQPDVVIPSDLHPFDFWNDISWRPVEQTQALLEKYGPELANLNLYLSMQLWSRKDRGQFFQIPGDTLLRDLGLEDAGIRHTGPRAVRRSEQLRRQAELAKLLAQVVVQVDDQTVKGERLRTTGRLWSITSRERRPPLQLGLDGSGSVEDDLLEDLQLLIRAEPLLLHYFPSGGEDRGGWFTRIPTEVLKLSRHRNRLAGVLGTTLATSLREFQAGAYGYKRLKVGSLLERLTPPRVLGEALEDRRAAFRLREQWRVAMAVVASRVGFRFLPCPDTYPREDFPQALASSLPAGLVDSWQSSTRGTALERLLGGYITVRWPEEVLEKPKSTSGARGLREAVVQESRKPLRGVAYCAELKTARTALGLSQRAAAAIVGTSFATLCRIETEQKIPDPSTAHRYLRRYRSWAQENRHRLALEKLES